MRIISGSKGKGEPLLASRGCSAEDFAAPKALSSALRSWSTRLMEAPERQAAYVTRETVTIEDRGRILEGAACKVNPCIS